MGPGVVEMLAGALEGAGVDLRAWGLAWARVAPTVTLVPAFGLRALPAPARIALGLALAAGIAPALAPAAEKTTPFVVLMATELAKGLPVALSAAGALWIASMVGGLADNLRGGHESAGLPNVEDGTTPTGALLAMLVAVAFLESGGAERVALALADPGLEFVGPLRRAASNLASGVGVAVAIAAPVVAASIVLEVASSLIARAAHPAFVMPLFAPLRALALLGIVALLLDRMVELLVIVARG
jgi:flagellar biosynthesis protein FliR